VQSSNPLFTSSNSGAWLLEGLETNPPFVAKAETLTVKRTKAAIKITIIFFIFLISFRNKKFTVY
jgi:hypothetical protein